MPNRLIHSLSPYLLQHAHNPVDWYPWGDEAIKKAKDEEKPILLSIGYSTCYWCHVMEREVFENKNIADQMNEWFVNIKVDREENPELDEIYMIATQIMTHHGGWPNNVFLTPELKPFFAGTYFPAKDNLSMHQPGFPTVIKKLHELWNSEKKRIYQDADKVSNHIIIALSNKDQPANSNIPDNSLVNTLLSYLKEHFDHRYGGFNNAPKFPQESHLLFLLDYYEKTQDEPILQMIEHTLHSIAKGGIHDHIGGGFHRYAVDRQWKIPHFEKMLYNQALLTLCFTKLHNFSTNPLYENIINKCLAFVTENFTDKTGLFYSALDAETDAVEGEFYVWDIKEVKESLTPDEFKKFKQYFTLEAIPKIKGQKHPEGKVLCRIETFSTIDTITDKLSKIRQKREKPALDNKVITAWNGLMIEAFALAGKCLKNTTYIEQAKKAADALFQHLYDKKEKVLYRIWNKNQRYQPGYCEDYSFFIKGLLALYNTTKEKQFLKQAEELTNITEQYFWDKEAGGFFFAKNQEPFFVHLKNASDTAIPSANATMVQNYLTFYKITGEEKYLLQTKKILSTFSLNMVNIPQQHCLLIQTLLHLPSEENTQDLKPPAPLSTESKLSITNNIEIKEDICIITITVNIADNWHIYGHSTKEKNVIKTHVTVSKDNKTIAPVSTEYPIDPLYEGKTDITLKFSKTKKPHDYIFTLHCQACSNNACVEPAKITIPLTF